MGSRFSASILAAASKHLNAHLRPVNLANVGIHFGLAQISAGQIKRQNGFPPARE